MNTFNAVLQLNDRMYSEYRKYEIWVYYLININDLFTVGQIYNIIKSQLSLTIVCFCAKLSDVSCIQKQT